MGINTVIARNLILIWVLIVSTAAANTNHTVGGSAGWFFNATTNSSATNYTSWAAKQTFSVGDFLIFQTNSNQTVIETYNKTIYQSCIYKNSTDDVQYGGGEGKLGETLTIEVPLAVKGSIYYFSNTGGKVQCQRGMAFEIQVVNGNGFLPDLNYAPPPPPGNGAFRIGGRGLYALLPLLLINILRSEL
ncbi:early nodulin-like protein 18 [Humulus lupulus]|uniref:early nodulin-like protein 18 n=1 Tax=Humulus lupulus TaxID=3486 RepID=UPI002B40EE15|nr:early nodulin-like protein 18 [Humulus lupulus]